MAQRKNRIVILSGPNVWNQSTCATIIESGLDVVGICMTQPQRTGVLLKFIRRLMKKRSLWRILGQIVGRVYYNMWNKRKDLEIRRQLFDEDKIASVIHEWERHGGKIYSTDNYSSEECLAWLESQKPDLFLVHTGGWVGKKVRKIPFRKIVIGGHPGLTPYYRGAHSAFWALYFGKPQDIGWSVFWLDEGVDTGDLVIQGRLKIEDGDSYRTLGWKGMIKQAQAQADAIIKDEAGVEIPRHPHLNIPPNTEFDVPTLAEYLRYRRRQKQVR